MQSIVFGNNQNNKSTVHTGFTDLLFTCHYPENNPPEAVRDITRALHHVGVLDSIKK
jgi:hypothetical protein